MKYLYAPWRDRYFSRKPKGCLFCNAAKSHRDKKWFVFHRGEKCFGMVNLFPYTTAHVMVAPTRHCGDFSKLKKDEITEMFDIAQKILKALKKIYRCEGFNLGVNQGSAAGAGFAGHIHLHIVGRWTGDTNFMTTAGSTRVICADPEKLYGELRDFFKK
ncbi:MAG: HIT domain-containing protein [Elusimicrobia bacterium]|nr:HIT domain-containing protein [Elusimicrobiota bacterium]